jgi:glycosyltransferase involved in cell wall biosynthesis
MTGPPLVSVLTPSYNQARWLPDNLRSVAAQSYRPIQHVVIDGGSTDGSRQILESASPTVQWHSGPDAGQSDAINAAFRVSNGDIIGWLNSDDAYFSRDVVAAVVRMFERHPDVGVVYGHAALVNGNGTLLHVLWTPSFAASLLRAYNLICQPTVFIRRSVINRPDLVDPDFDYSMDRELWLHLAEHTRFARLNRILAIDRHHLRRKSLTRPDLAKKDRELIARRYRIPHIASNSVLHRTTKIAVRLAGLSKVMEAAHGSDVLPLEVPSPPAIAVRQVAQLRRWMPSGEDLNGRSVGR